MALTPEEEKELAALESELGSDEAQSISSTAASGGLTPEEARELAFLEESLAQEPDEEGPGLMETAEHAARVGVQGATLGFSDEILGTAIAGVRKLQGDETPFSEIQQQEIALQREDLEKAKEALGTGISTGLEIAGNIGGALASGLATAGIRGASILGGATTVGVSNKTGTELVGEFAKGATLGAVTEVGISKVLAPAAKATINKVSNMMSKSSTGMRKLFSDLGETRHPQNAQFEAATIRDIFTGAHDTADDWLISESALKRADQAIDEIPEIIDDMVGAEMKTLGVQLKDIKGRLGAENSTLNVESSLGKLQSDLGEILKLGNDKRAVNIIKRDIIEPLEKGSLGTFGGDKFNMTNLSVDQAHKLKKSIANLTYSKTASGGEFVDTFRNSPQASQALKNFTDDIITQFNQLDPELAAVNQRFTKLYQIDELKPATPAAASKLGTNLKTDKASVNNRAFVQSMDGYDPEFARTVIKEVNPRLKLFTAVKEAELNPASAVKQGRFGLVSGIASLGESGLALSAQAAGKVTRQIRDAFKVPRSTAGIIQNGDLVVSKLAELSPTLAVVLSQAIADRDVNTIRKIATEALMDPQAAQGFEDGIGFDGKIANPEELQQIEGQIKRLPVRARAKLEMLNEVRSTGSIPNLGTAQQVAPPPFQKIFEKKRRDKSGRKVTDF